MMSILVAVLIALGIICSPEQATQQVIDDHTEQLREVIGDDLLDT